MTDTTKKINNILVEVQHPQVTTIDSEGKEYVGPGILKFVALDDEDFNSNKTLITFTEAETNRKMMFPMVAFVCAHEIVAPAEEATKPKLKQPKTTKDKGE